MKLAGVALWLVAALGVLTILTHWPALFLPAWAALAVSAQWMTEERAA